MTGSFVTSFLKMTRVCAFRSNVKCAKKSRLLRVGIVELE